MSSLRKIQRQAAVCREIAQIVLKSVFQGIPADRCLALLMRQHRELGSRDRRLLYDLIFALFRWWGWFNRWENAEQMDQQFLASLVLDGKLDHPVLVHWGRKQDLPKNWLEMVRSITLSQKVKLLMKWHNQPLARYDLNDLFPSWFLKGLHLPEEDHSVKNESAIKAEILSILQIRPPIWVRFDEKNGKIMEQNFLENGIAFHRHSILASAGTLSSSISFNHLTRYNKMKFEIQDLSSQIVGWACNPQPGENWWDVCAGGGGKTLHLSALMNGTGKILATDKRKSALKEARRRCQKWKYNQVRFKTWVVGEGERPSSSFDGVLLDAPCSGTGTWRRNPDARWRTSISDVQHYVQVQKQILNACSQVVKPGGKLIYSVCSLLKQETLSVINDFIDSQSEFQFGSIWNPLTKKMNEGILWILPHHQNSDGMFIACLKRKR